MSQFNGTIEFGTVAYVLKERVGDLDGILHALRAVAQGGSVVDPKVVEALLSRRTREAESPLTRLTPREMNLLTRGWREVGTVPIDYGGFVVNRVVVHVVIEATSVAEPGWKSGSESSK